MFTVTSRGCPQVCTLKGVLTYWVATWDCAWFAVIWWCFRDVTTQGRAVQPAAFRLSPLRSQASHLIPLQSDMPLHPLYSKSDYFTFVCSASLCFFPSNVSEVKAVCSSRSICTYTSHVKESDAKTSEHKHPLDKSGRIYVHNRRAFPRRSRSGQITVFPITAESIWLILLTKLGSRICCRRKDSHPHQDLVHLQPGPLPIPPFQLLNLGVASSNFHYEQELLPQSLLLDTEKNIISEIKYHFLFEV